MLVHSLLICFVPTAIRLKLPWTTLTGPDQTAVSPQRRLSLHTTHCCVHHLTHTHTQAHRHTHTHTHTHSHSHSHRHEDQTNTWRFIARSKCSFGTVGTE